MAQSSQEPDSKKRRWDEIQISDRCISDIINLLGPDDLRNLFYALDLPSRVIDKAEIKAGTSDVDLKARRVLETWRQRNGQQATQERVLCALEECGNKDARERLEDKWRMKGGSCQFDLEDCKNELIKFYKHQMGKVQLLPWCDESRDMDEIYVSLELEEKKGRDTTLLQHNEDLVTLTTTQGLPASRVLVKGVAGSGKSTLLAKLAYSWAQQKSDSPLFRFDLVFTIALREVHRDSRPSLVDAIFNQILAEATTISKEKLQTFIEKHPSNVIILLDGFDEYGHDTFNTDKENDIDKIVHFHVLRDCRVILSTRPHKQLGKYQSHYVSVNLTGFSPDNVTLYMKKVLKGNTEMVEGLSNRLTESEILTSLSTIPVILMLMCLLWEDEQKLPDTQSELYQEFALYLWRNYCIKQDKQDNDTEFNKAISELGQTAFAGLCPEGNFSQSQFELGCQTGLLTRERLRSKLHMISHVTFLHKSFQEYCAAKYWASLFDTNPDQFQSILKQIRTWDVLLSKLELLKFCCGLVNKAGKMNVIHHAIHVFQCSVSMADTHCAQVGYYREKEIELSPILNLLYESQITPSDDNSSSRLQTNLQYEHVSADYTMLSAEDQQQSPKVMLFPDQAVISLFSQGILEVYGKPPKTMSIFHNFVKSAHGLSLLAIIKSVRFREYPVASLDIITDTLKCMPDVQEVNIHFDNTDSQALPVEQSKCLGEKLSTLPKCTKIAISPSDVNNRHLSVHAIVHALSLYPYCPHYIHIKFSIVTFNITHMAHLLSKTNMLKTLILLSNEMHPGDVMSILDAIQSKLEHLILSDNHVAEAIGHIGHIMTPHLQTLDLESASLKEDHITLLSEFLPKASNLESLDLSRNNIGMAIVPLAHQLQYCTKLSSLDLLSAHIPDQGIIELANRFTFMSNLACLGIRGNDIGNGGVHVVFKDLYRLTKLETLWIDATIDNQCSDLVKDCLWAIGETIPDTGSHKIIIRNDSKVQLLIKATHKQHNKQMLASIVYDFFKTYNNEPEC
ncbi:LOW QUALITY PROTEIN: uncharacterized protein [Amphiura filiformis]|uniref:LOW QUALITY PROTEIN: uncharacterized protein n=1 Tax=Amphiura filiformis TaxID=82378 RepID=UPI003B21021F